MYNYLVIFKNIIVWIIWINIVQGQMVFMANFVALTYFVEFD